MTKYRLFPIGFSIAVILLSRSSPANSAQKPAWKGTITTEIGVKVVKNPAEPLYGTLAFELQEDLKIGGDPNDAPSYFPKGGVLSVDGKGNLFFADRGNERVQMYDQFGKFIRTIGRKGQGPGEYIFSGQVFFDVDGNTCVRDARQFVVFGKDGIFKKKIPLTTFLNQLMIGPGGSIIGTTQPSAARGEPKYALLMLDPEGKMFRTIAEFKGELAQSEKVIIIHWYSNSFAFSPLAADTFAYGFSDDYKIFVADRNGKIVLIIEKQEKPKAITAKEKTLTEKEGMFAWMGISGEPNPRDIRYPDHRPYFGRFYSDDMGRLYVIRHRSIMEKEAPMAVDVFSKDGIYLYKMTWPAFPSAIKNGCLYEVREDKDTGEYTIVRSRIKNWEKMKTGAD
jgi:hypothetical protein